MDHAASQHPTSSAPSGSAGDGVALTTVVDALDAELRTREIADYGGAVNGLQLANSGRVHQIAVAVDASLPTIIDAIDRGADLLIVHHGLFWGGAQPITGVVRERIKRCLDADLAIYSSHLPLDAHATLGNNARLAATLGLEPSAPFGAYKGADIGLQGDADLDTVDVVARARQFAASHGHAVRTAGPVEGRRTRRWAMITGGGATTDSLRDARAAGVDTFITGEGAHHTAVDAMEHDLCVIYAGHYATETLGVQALGAWCQERFGLPWSFIAVPTGL